MKNLIHKCIKCSVSFKFSTASEINRFNRADYRCTECYREYNKQYRKRIGKNSARNKQHALKSIYGISLQDYNSMLIKQNYKCAICNQKPLDVGRKKLAVDHCHDTGVIRGLLCSNCNSALGSMKDNITSLISAISYLEGSNE